MAADASGRRARRCGLAADLGVPQRARQAKIIRDKLAEGSAIRAILRFLAAPGCSEHHTGRALDIGSPSAPDFDAGFARTREFRWLGGHAAHFGFHQTYPRRNPHHIGYEPWHWCWRAGGQTESCPAEWRV